MKAQPLGIQLRSLLFPGRQYPAGLEGFVLAHVGLLSRRERFTGHGRAAPDCGLAGSEPRVGRLVLPPSSPELDELFADLVWHCPGDRLEL